MEEEGCPGGLRPLALHCVTQSRKIKGALFQAPCAVVNVAKENQDMRLNIFPRGCSVWRLCRKQLRDESLGRRD